MIYNKKSDMIVYVTNDYNMFKRLKGNRQICLKHVDEIVKSISRGDNRNPILVNEFMEIADGQHTLEARKILSKDIYYRIEPGADIDAVILANTHNKKWVLTDFVKSFMEMGNQNYYDLWGFHTKNPHLQSLGMSILLLSGETSSTKSDDITRKGNFKVNIEIKKAQAISDSIKESIQYVRPNIVTLYNFMYAFVRVAMHKDYDPKKMVTKMSAGGGSILPVTTSFEYMEGIEACYNFRSRNKIFFTEGYIKRRRR